MSEASGIPLLDHELADDELAWMKAVYEDFGKIRGVVLRTRNRVRPEGCAAAGPWPGRAQARPPTWTCRDPVPGGSVKIAMAEGLPRSSCRKWSCIGTRKAEPTSFPCMWLARRMRSPSSRDGQPVLTPVTGGDHFHNSPDAPHAFLPKVGKPIPENWEIAFIAITPRNLREDTQAVSDDVRAAYRTWLGRSRHWACNVVPTQIGIHIGADRGRTRRPAAREEKQQCQSRLSIISWWARVRPDRSSPTA